MTESFNKSFNEDFCIELEYTLCSVFSNCEVEELKRFWCDGVSWAPYYNSEVNKDYLSFEKVKTRLHIETSARMGVSGQERFEMKINFGEKSLDRYKNEEIIVDCIPSKENSDWIEIEINLL